MNGILCIDKPSGMTSFAVVSEVRKLTGERKAGHAGTLDPMATGVLPVLLGRATKALELLPSGDKRYTAVMKLGVTTDTGDVTGTVTSQKAVAAGRAEVAGALEHFKGEIMQVPPMYSARKVQGRKLYELARRGLEVRREARKIHIYEIALVGCDEAKNEYTIDVACSKGTYIRTLCGDIGELLGCGATMAGLRRTEAAGFSLADCVPLDQARDLAEKDRLAGRIFDVESVFRAYPPVAVTDKQAVRFINGGALFLSRLPSSLSQGMYRVKAQDGRFLGLGEAQDGELKVKCLLAGGCIFADH